MESSTNQKPFKENDILNINGKKYIVLVSTKDKTVLLELDTNRYNFQTYITDFLISLVNTRIAGNMGPAPKSEDYQCLISQAETDACRDEKTVIDKILQAIYPDYELLQGKMGVPAFEEYLSRFGISPATGHRKIRRYLQSGRSLDSLGRKKYSNRKSPERKPLDKTAFEKGYKILKDKKELTVTGAYETILHSCYKDEYGDYLPESVIPSEASFRRYVMKKIAPLSLKEFLNNRKYRNNCRLLTGDAQYDVSHPGEVLEMDGCEVDFIIVSEKDPDQVIGRPHIVFAIDVYSTMLCAYTAGFETNSFIGATDLFTQLFFTKDDRLSDSGATLRASCFVPQSIRVDHGSEYISKALRRFGQETGIDITLVPPGMGSMKGIVESSFHQFQSKLRDEGRFAGAVKREDGIDGKKYACITMTDFRAVVEDFIVLYNQSLRSNILTPEMINEGVTATACDLWDYGVNHRGAPEYVTSARASDLFFALLHDDKTFKVSREGIYTGAGLIKYYKNEYWLNSLMRSCGTGRKKTLKMEDVRYDPRSVNSIYTMREGKLETIPMRIKSDALSAYKDLTWAEYEEIVAKKKEMDRETRMQSTLRSADFRGKTREMLEEAKKGKTGRNTTTGIGMARKTDQMDDRRDKEIRKVILGQALMKQPVPELDESPLLEEGTPMISGDTSQDDAGENTSGYNNEEDDSVWKPTSPEDFFF